MFIKACKILLIISRTVKHSKRPCNVWYYSCMFGEFFYVLFCLCKDLIVIISTMCVFQCDAWYTVVGLLVRSFFPEVSSLIKIHSLVAPSGGLDVYNFTCLFSDSHPRKLGQKQYRYLSSMIWLNQQECYISAAPAKATVTVLSKTHHVLFVPRSSCLVDKALFIL